MEKPENKATKILSMCPQHNEFIVNTREFYSGQLYQASITSNFDSGNLRDLIVNSQKPNHVP
jgi:hypothetical protein